MQKRTWVRAVQNFEFRAGQEVCSKCRYTCGHVTGLGQKVCGKYKYTCGHVTGWGRKVMWREAMNRSVDVVVRRNSVACGLLLCRRMG